MICYKGFTKTDKTELFTKESNVIKGTRAMVRVRSITLVEVTFVVATLNEGIGCDSGH